MTYLTTPPAKTLSAAPHHPMGALVVALRRLAAVRLTVRRLRPLSDRQLRDIGLIRGDVDRLATGSLSADVATDLALRAGTRAGNW